MRKQLPDDKNSEQESLHRGNEVQQNNGRTFIEICRNLDKVCPESKHKQRLKRCMMELSFYDKCHCWK